MKLKFHNRFASRSSSLALAAMPSSVFRPLLVMVISMGFGGNAWAATQYWDTSTSSGYQVGNGDWGTSSDWTTNGTTLATWTSGNSAYFNGSGISSVTVNSAVSAAAVHIGDAPGNGTNTSVFFSGSSTLTLSNYFGVGWEADSQNGTHNYTASDTFIQTGGTISITASGMIIGRFATTGSYYMSGGSLTTPNATNSIRLGNSGASGANPGASSGTFVIDGGTVSTGGTTGTTGPQITLGTSGYSGAYGTGVLSLNSGSLSAGVLTMAATSYTTGTLDLNNTGSGSTLTLSQITAATGTTSSTSTFNFNGGTLKPSAASSTFMGGLTGAYIYAGGAVIDTSSATGTTTISQNLLAATNGGYGLAMSALTPSTAGAGYKSAPTVAFGAPSSGTTATGYAVLNSDGTINKIVITNPGSGYTNSQSVSVTLSGGGSTTAATFNSAAASADQTTGGLTKLGSNTLTLSGTNTYTGATTISAGTLSVSSIVVSGGSSNLGNATSSVTLGAASTQGTLSYTGSSATYTRGFTIGGAGGGRLDVTASGQTLQVNTGNITGTGLFTVGGAGNITINANLTHTGGLTKTDAGTLTLSGTGNTYNGLTTVSAGELDLNTTGGQSLAGNLTVSGGTAKLLQASQINTASSLVVGGGTFDIQGYNQTVANVQLTSGTISGSGGTLTSSNAYDMQAGTVSAQLGGTVGLNKTTGSTVTLSGANTYTGGTTVNAGTLVLSNNSAAGTGDIALSGASASVKITATTNLTGNNITVSDKTASVIRDVGASSAYNVGTTGNLTSHFTDISNDKPDTTASIRAGTNGSTAATLAMSFSNESNASNDGIRRSDVFTLNNSQSFDAFVLQITASGLASDSVLGWKNGGGLWDFANTGNIGTNTTNTAYLNYQGSFTSFLNTYNSGTFDPNTMLGAYGVDPAAGAVWAVVDHVGSFTAVPEPTSALVGLLIGAGLLRRRRTA